MPPPLSSLTAVVPVSKLHPPRVRHSELTRCGLLQDPEISGAEILAIGAPAGYGKSTFAIQWASRPDMPVAWLTCDDSDSDAVVLISGLTRALQNCGVGYEPPDCTLTVREPAFSRTVLPCFAQSVAALPGPLICVIDDLHLVNSPKATKVLVAFIDALPAGSQVALVGRNTDAVPVPLWRGQGRVIDIGPTDLRFSEEETGQALSMFGRDPDSGPTAADVLTATQGWPVAVFLMSQTGRPHDVPTSIDELIRSEVIDPLPEPLRTFVLSTAALGMVTEELSRAVTGEPHSAKFLDQTIATTLMQRHEQGFRYHPLLQDCATSLLEREDPERLRQVRAAAARWHLAQGHVEAAVHLALLSADEASLAAVMWPAIRISLLRGQALTVQQWLTRIDKTTVMSLPELSLAAAWTSMATSDFGSVLTYVRATLAAMPEDWRDDLGASELRPHLAILLAVTGETLPDPGARADFADEALRALGPEDPMCPLGTLVVGLNRTLTGHPDAEGTLRGAAALAQAAQIPSTEVEASAMLGLLLMGQGEDTAGCQEVDRAAAVFALHALDDMASTSGVLAIAQVARTVFRGNRADVAAARRTLDAIRPKLESLMPWYRPLAGSVLAFACVRTGDLPGFHEHIAWCEQSDAPPTALCRTWAARARQEYAAASPLRNLTPAELRVWGLLQGRMTLSEIGETLFLSRETVKSHTVSIYRKLGVGSRREAQDLAESWN